MMVVLDSGKDALPPYVGMLLPTSQHFSCCWGSASSACTAYAGLCVSTNWHALCLTNYRTIPTDLCIPQKQ